jgi:hypothetical protein
MPAAGSSRLKRRLRPGLAALQSSPEYQDYEN